MVARWETKAYALLAFLRHPKPIRRYLYTTNQLERGSKEVRRRTKRVKAFWGEEAVEKLLYLVLERAAGRALVAGLCGSVDGKPPCCSDTMNATLREATPQVVSLKLSPKGPSVPQNSRRQEVRRTSRLVPKTPGTVKEALPLSDISQCSGSFVYRALRAFC